jgi:hypothetical protein
MGSGWNGNRRFIYQRSDDMSSGTDGRGIQGGMPLWLQGVDYSAAREGEAARGSERWKGEVSFPSRLGGGRKCGLLSAKGGLMMGTKKVGVLSSPRKKTNLIISKKLQLSNFFEKFFIKKKIVRISVPLFFLPFVLFRENSLFFCEI